MSHIAQYTTKIVLPWLLSEGLREHDPAWRMLREAVELTATELGGKVVPYIIDYYNAATDCDFGIVTPEFRRGVGIQVQPGTGEVRFLYDDYGGYKLQALKICERIQQNYASLAVTRALQALNYEVEVSEERDENGARRVTVKGVS